MTDLPSSPPPPPPPPSDSGSANTQISVGETDSQILSARVVESPIHDFPMTETLRTFADAGVRGQSGMAMLIANVNILESQNVALRSERESLRSQLDARTEDYYGVKEELAVTRESERSAREANLLRGICVTLGAAIAGAAGSFLATAATLSPPAVACLIAGALLLIIGWAMPRETHR